MVESVLFSLKVQSRSSIGRDYDALTAIVRLDIRGTKAVSKDSDSWEQLNTSSDSYRSHSGPDFCSPSATGTACLTLQATSCAKDSRPCRVVGRCDTQYGAVRRCERARHGRARRWLMICTKRPRILRSSRVRLSFCLVHYLVLMSRARPRGKVSSSATHRVAVEVPSGRVVNTGIHTCERIIFRYSRILSSAAKALNCVRLHETRTYLLAL